MREEAITIAGILLLGTCIKDMDLELAALIVQDAKDMQEDQNTDQMSVSDIGAVVQEVADDLDIDKDPWEEYAEDLHAEKEHVGEGLSDSERAFYRRFYPTAMMEQRRYGIPFSIKMAQGALEGNWGKSTLAVNANNHFGIKTKSRTGYPHADDEKGDRFRRYASSWESWRDHSRFLSTNPRYSPLFRDKFNRVDWLKYSKNQKCLKKGSRGCTVTGPDPRFQQKLRDLERNWNVKYKRWSIGLSILNYATDPNYDRTLINLIEKKRFYESDI